jgi:hypothetical protein
MQPETGALAPNAKKNEPVVNNQTCKLFKTFFTVDRRTINNSPSHYNLQTPNYVSSSTNE